MGFPQGRLTFVEIRGSIETGMACRSLRVVISLGFPNVLIGSDSKTKLREVEVNEERGVCMWLGQTAKAVAGVSVGEYG